LTCISSVGVARWLHCALRGGKSRDDEQQGDIVASNDNAGGGGTCRRLMAHLPWGAWTSLAGVSYVALHALARRPQTIVVDPGDVCAALASFLLGGVVESLQYVVPSLCLSALLVRLALVPEARIGPGAIHDWPADGGPIARPPCDGGAAHALAIAIRVS
jgi:hypothetical protein